jgi:hypothetical protein
LNASISPTCRRERGGEGARGRGREEEREGRGVEREEKMKVGKERFVSGRLT